MDIVNRSMEMLKGIPSWNAPCPIQSGTPLHIPVAPIAIEAVEAAQVSGVKRSAFSVQARLGKKAKLRSDSSALMCLDVEEGFGLPNDNGKVKVSPLKTKRGRPKGSKNKLGPGS